MTLRTEHTLVDEQGRPVEPGARVRNIETGLIGTIGRAEETPEGWDVYFHIDMGSDRPYDLKAAEVVRRFSLQEPEVKPKPSAELDDILDHLEGRDVAKPSETDGSPGIYRGPFAGGQGSGEIGVRWAKETIGLVAVELNEAYAEFDIGRDGYEMPSGKLYGATERLKEAMQRLGITGDEIPF